MRSVIEYKYYGLYHQTFYQRKAMKAFILLNWIFIDFVKVKIVIAFKVLYIGIFACKAGHVTRNNVSTFFTGK